MAYGRFRVPAKLMEEIWKTIEEFPRYEVSNLGRVRSLIKGRPIKVLNTYLHWKGYRHIYLYREGIPGDVKCFIHRLVAKAFIPNPENHPIVNHKNLAKDHNHVENLEWVDASGNMMHWRNARTAEEQALADEF